MLVAIESTSPPAGCACPHSTTFRDEGHANDCGSAQNLTHVAAGRVSHLQTFRNNV